MSVRRNSSRTNVNSAYNTAAVQTSNSKTIAPDTAVLRETSGGSFAPTITAVAITNSDYNIIDDTNVSTGGGYIRITGTGFVSGCVVYVGGVAALSTTLLNSTQVNVQINATSSNTLHVYLVNPNGTAAIYLSGITFSGVPTWATDSTLSGLTTDVAFSIGLSATSNSTVVYALTAGSTLPPGTSLNSAGVFSGTVAGLSADTTYSFSVTATDSELQDTPRTFSVTVSIGDPYLYLTPVLLNGEANVWIRDSSVNKFLPTVGNDTKPSAFSPYNTTWSGYFNGSTDYLAGTCGALGAGDFTVEFWSNQPAATGRMYYFTIGAGPEWAESTGASLLEYDGNFAMSCGSTTSITIRTNATRNVWNHIAVVRYNGVVTLYYNGVAAGTTISNATNLTGTLFRVGSGNVNSGSWLTYAGYMSNFRIVAGTAVYTTNFTPPTNKLTAIANTRILTLQDNRFIDNSITPVTITVGGSPASRSVTPFVDTDTTTGSAYFDGTGDHLIIADNAAMELGAGDFCIECWIYTTTVSGTGIVLDKRSGGYSPILLWRSSGNLVLYLSSSGGSWSIINATTMVAMKTNTWYHVAVYRVGSAIYYSVNGTVTSAATSNATLTNNATNWYIGTETDGSTNPWTGYIADMRFVVGSSPYGASNFTPPAQSLSAIANTQFLSLQYRQGNNNHRFIDEAGPKAIVARAGNASLGTFSPFSPTGWSAYFDGTGDYLTLADNDAWDFGNGNFTVEGWFNTTVSASYGCMVGQISSSAQAISSAWGLYPSTTSGVPNFIFSLQGVGVYSVTASSVATPTNSWNHLAAVRNGSTITLYLNGTNVGTSSVSTTSLVQSSASLAIGRAGDYNGDYYTGYASNIRIVKGVAVYTGNFTPPTSILGNTQSSGSNIAAITGTSTSLLTLQDNRFKDNSTNAYAITKSGDARIQAFSPFRGSGTYTPATHGGSMYIDGSGDYVLYDSPPNLTLGTGDFAIEFWVYGLAASAWWCFDCRPGGDGAYPLVYWDATSFVYYVNTGARITSTAINIVGQWTHVVVSRVSGSTRMFVNGTVQSTVYSDSTSFLSPGSSRPYIGLNGLNGLGPSTGYLSGLRVTSGAGVTSVTVPTAPPALTANTSILNNFTNAGIYDATGRTIFETVGSVTVSNVQSKFGVGSISFPGALTAYLKAPTNPSLDFGTGDFTVECWVYFNSVASDQGLFGGSTTNAWEIRWRTSSGLNLGRLNTAFDSTFAWSPSINTWYHVAVTRSGTSVRGFINGTQIGSTSTNSNTYNSGTLFYVGLTDTSNNAFNGFLDDIRITKGYARYTANFTAPNSAHLTK